MPSKRSLTFLASQHNLNWALQPTSFISHAKDSPVPKLKVLLSSVPVPEGFLSFCTVPLPSSQAFYVTVSLSPITTPTNPMIHCYHFPCHPLSKTLQSCSLVVEVWTCLLISMALGLHYGHRLFSASWNTESSCAHPMSSTPSL